MSTNLHSCIITFLLTNNTIQFLEVIPFKEGLALFNRHLQLKELHCAGYLVSCTAHLLRLLVWQWR